MQHGDNNHLCSGKHKIDSVREPVNKRSADASVDSGKTQRLVDHGTGG